MRKEIVKTTIVLRWFARIWSIASLTFFVAFIVGEGSLPNPTEAVGLIFFPIGVAVGFVIAWWREGIGGAITVMSLGAFYIWNMILDGRLPRGPYFVLLAAPGFLFLANWLLGRLQSIREPSKAT